MRLVRRRALLLGATVITLSAGCHSWTPISVPAPPAPVTRMRNPLRVELRDGRAYELVDVVIATDSLFGSANDPSRVRSAFHLSQIARLEELRDDNRRTIGLIVLIAVLGAMGGLTGF